MNALLDATADCLLKQKYTDNYIQLDSGEVRFRVMRPHYDVSLECASAVMLSKNNRLVKSALLKILVDDALFLLHREEAGTQGEGGDGESRR
eukprot:4595414-Amphidinium_carterae.1